MKNMNRKLYKKGFSLIELMVAVTILAITVLGIVLAFTTGFMGMTDAKERTVATNLAQKIMEDIKSNNAVNVMGGYPTETISEKTYDVSVNSYEQEEKTYVTVTVSWPGRNGNIKNVDLETVFYDLATIYAVAEIGEIVLTSENPVMSCDEVVITATVTGPDGTPVADGVEVIFSLIQGMGEFSPHTVPTKDGDGTAEGTLSLLENSATQLVVKASSRGKDSNKLSINIYPPNLGVIAEPTSLAICEESIVTATLRNSVTANPMVGKPINFTTDDGELNRNYDITDEYGKAQVTLSSDSEITTSVNAVYCGLDPITTDYIIFSKPKILLKAEPLSIPVDGSSTITATVTDSSSNENPVADGTEILFTIQNDETPSVEIFSESASTTGELGEAQITIEHSSVIGYLSIVVQASYCAVSSDSITISVESVE